MTKEEKIKEAYGSLYELNKQFIDSDGWLDNSEGAAYLTFGDTKHLGGCEYREDIFIRPKSLAGIEDNNGWIKIEREEDLPNELKSIDYKVFKKSNQFSFMLNTYKKHEVKELWVSDEITHYQAINDFKPPIY